MCLVHGECLCILGFIYIYIYIHIFVNIYIYIYILNAWQLQAMYILECGLAAFGILSLSLLCMVSGCMSVCAYVCIHVNITRVSGTLLSVCTSYMCHVPARVHDPESESDFVPARFVW